MPNSNTNNNNVQPTPQPPAPIVQRKIGLIDWVQEFQRDYTVNCFKRTAPYEETLPITFTKVLTAVAVMTKSLKGSDSVVEVDAVTGRMASDGLKTSQSVSTDLCRMTADPFPLLVSSKKNSMDDTIYRPSPLYSISDGSCTQTRYSKVGLSALGELATRHYKNSSIKNTKSLKSIVPLSLLRKTVPWTLGHRSVNYSYNPSELFRLQARMIELGTSLLPDADVAEIFKGPDVGEGYVAFMKNESARSAYHLGKGSFTVVPNITINRNERYIEFEKPPLSMTTEDFIDYINKRLISKETDGDFPKFKTFEATTELPALSGIKARIKEVNFLADDDKIIEELREDRVIKVTSPLSNVLLRPIQNSTDTMRIIDSLNIEDSALDNFEVDGVPMHEILWKHIQWELEIQLKKIQEEIDQLMYDLETDLFLEKVTRTEVADYIAQFLNREKSRVMREELIKAFHVDSEHRNKDLLPEGFKTWEIDEICRESTANSRTNLVITRIMFFRDKYESAFLSTQEKIDSLQKLISNPQLIYSDIRKELLKYAAMPNLQRKTKVYFLEEIKEFERDIEYNFTFNTSLWDTLYIPVTLYYNSREIVKSYGRNINYIPYSTESRDTYFTNALNLTTLDKVYLFLDGRVELSYVNQFSSTPVDLGFLYGVIPFSETKDIMVNVENYYQENGVYKRHMSSFFVIPAGGLTEQIVLNGNQRIGGWCYLDKEYVDLLTYQDLGNDNHSRAYIRVKTEEIPRTQQLQPYSEHFSPVTDILSTDGQEELVNLLANGLDRIRKPDNILYSFYPHKSPTSFIDREVYDYMSNHIEVYSDKTLITDWKMIDLVVSQKLPHGKKSVINELIWCRPDDLISKRYHNVMNRKLSEIKRSLKMVISYESESYIDYKISGLADWSIINSRFRLPNKRPTDLEALEIYDKYMNLLMTCLVSDKAYRDIKGELSIAADLVIRQLGHNPFIDDKVEELIPIIEDPSDDNMEDDSVLDF